MKERPILFSGPMVRAILDGRKTQTRRVVKPQPVELPNGNFSYTARSGLGFSNFPLSMMWEHSDGLCPYGQPGDLLIVKEAAWLWCEQRPNGTTKTGKPKWHFVPQQGSEVYYCADHPEKPTETLYHPLTGNTWGWRKKLGRFLPRWASRITLQVTGVRIERLQEISEEDSKAEGLELKHMNDGRDVFATSCPNNWDTDPRESFRTLWQSINGTDSWQANPWVWVVQFRRVEQ